MEINALPDYDMSDNPTNCCPRFKPEGWDKQVLHFKDKLFIKAETRSIFHIPLNIGSVFTQTLKAIDSAEAQETNQFIVLSHDLSAWRSEHYFSVSRDVPGQDLVQLNGEYLTRVFEGPYRKIPVWEKEMEDFVVNKGVRLKKIYYFYTTCPKCAKFYGKNYVVAVAETE